MPGNHRYWCQQISHRSEKGERGLSTACRKPSVSVCNLESQRQCFVLGIMEHYPVLVLCIIPFDSRWLRLEVVDGETPFLLSNAFLKATAADVVLDRESDSCVS